MNQELSKKYGLSTAIAMVVGIVIGSGVFFKAEKILTATGGNLPLGILSWVIGGLIMISCACTFAVMATKYERVNGIVDYAEAAMGRTYGYYVGWFMAMIYYPTLTSVLAWEKLAGPLLPASVMPAELASMFKAKGHDLIIVNSEYKASTDEENAQIAAIDAETAATMAEALLGMLVAAPVRSPRAG